MKYNIIFNGTPTIIDGTTEFKFRVKDNSEKGFTEFSIDIDPAIRPLEEQLRKLPSAFQNGDKVRLSFADAGKIDNCEVIKVHFTDSKVLYDVSVEMTIEGEKYHTRLYNIDSAMVMPAI